MGRTKTKAKDNPSRFALSLEAVRGTPWMRAALPKLWGSARAQELLLCSKPATLMHNGKRIQPLLFPKLPLACSPAASSCQLCVQFPAQSEPGSGTSPTDTQLAANDSEVPAVSLLTPISCYISFFFLHPIVTLTFSKSNPRAQTARAAPASPSLGAPCSRQVSGGKEVPPAGSWQPPGERECHQLRHPPSTACTQAAYRLLHLLNEAAVSR